MYVVGRAALAHPCASRHLDILSIVVGGMDAGSDLLKLPPALVFAYAINDNVLQLALLPKTLTIFNFPLL